MYAPPTPPMDRAGSDLGPPPDSPPDMDTGSPPPPDDMASPPPDLFDEPPPPEDDFDGPPPPPPGAPPPGPGAPPPPPPPPRFNNDEPPSDEGSPPPSDEEPPSDDDDPPPPPPATKFDPKKQGGIGGFKLPSPKSMSLKKVDRPPPEPKQREEQPLIKHQLKHVERKPPTPPPDEGIKSLNHGLQLKPTPQLDRTPPPEKSNKFEIPALKKTGKAPSPPAPDSPAPPGDTSDLGSPPPGSDLGSPPPDLGSPPAGDVDSDPPSDDGEGPPDDDMDSPPPPGDSPPPSDDEFAPPSDDEEPPDDFGSPAPSFGSPPPGSDLGSPPPGGADSPPLPSPEGVRTATPTSPSGPSPGGSQPGRSPRGSPNSPQSERGPNTPEPAVRKPSRSESSNHDDGTVSSASSSILRDRITRSRKGSKKGKIPKKLRKAVDDLTSGDESVPSKRNASDSGYVKVEGKFDGFEEDIFEPMHIAIKQDSLFIRPAPEEGDESSPDDDIAFDLTEEGTFVFIDDQDPLVFILEHEDKRILFRTPNTAALMLLLPLIPGSALDESAKKVINSTKNATQGDDNAAVTDTDDFWNNLPAGRSVDPVAVEAAAAKAAGSGGDQENNRENENKKTPTAAGRRFSFAPGGLNLQDVRASMSMNAIDMIGGGEVDLGLGLNFGKHPAEDDRYDYHFDTPAGQNKDNMRGDSTLPTALGLSWSSQSRHRSPSPSNRIKSSYKKKSHEEDVFEIGPRVKGYNRKVLLDSKLQKPLYSVRRVKQLCKWVTSMHVWKNAINIQNLHVELCSGLLLCRIMQVVVPGTEFLHLNEKALSKKPALENLEKGLGVIWRTKCVNNSRIPSAMDIFTGNASKIAIMLQEVFEVYVQRPLYRIAPKMFTWYDAILRQYQRHLPKEIFTEGNLSRLWSHFQSGFCIFCILYHLHGNVTVGEGTNAVRIDSMRIYAEPSSIVEFRSNITYIFSILGALGIEVIWDLQDWISYADTEFVVLQLFYIYEALQSRQCSLPPAQGTSAGVTSGANGEPQVTGMIYADSRPASSRVLQKKHRTVLMGSGDESLAVLPVDTSGTSRSNDPYRLICPAGLLAYNCKVVPSTIDIKNPRANSERRDWNSSAHTSNMIESKYDIRYTEMLKTKTRSTSPTKGTGISIEPKETKDMIKLNRNSLLQAMEDLEQNMAESQKELEALEDELAARYLDLERRGAGFIPPAEYKVRFDNLEREALLLAEERVRLEEHFAVRLSSIKQQHMENLGKNGENVGDVTPLAGKSGSNHAAYEMTPTTLFSPLRTSTSTKKNKAFDASTTATIDQQQKKKAERGWNSHCVRRGTYNFALSKMQSDATTALKNMWDPSKSYQQSLKAMEKSKKAANQKDSSSQDKYGAVPAEVAAVWKKFTAQLKKDSLTYERQLKAREEAKKWNAEQEVAAALITPVKTTIPIKSNFNLTAAKHKRYSATGNIKMQNSIGLHDEATATAIRNIESSAMEREEEYRREWMAERGLGTMSKANKSGIFQSTPFKGTPASIPKTTPSTRTDTSPRGVSKPETPNSVIKGGVPNVEMSVDAAMAYLASSRRIQLADRYVRKDFFWKVSCESMEGKEVFVLRWRDLDYDSVVGHVFTADIVNIVFPKSNPLLLEVSVGTAPRALVGTGGRAVVSMMFPSEVECKKYGKALMALTRR